jgi:hypothetical protein
MRLTIAALIGTSFAISFVLTLIIKRIAPRFGSAHPLIAAQLLRHDAHLLQCLTECLRHLR